MIFLVIRTLDRLGSPKACFDMLLLVSSSQHAPNERPPYEASKREKRKHENEKCRDMKHLMGLFRSELGQIFFSAVASLHSEAIKSDDCVWTIGDFYGPQESAAYSFQRAFSFRFSKVSLRLRFFPFSRFQRSGVAGGQQTKKESTFVQAQCDCLHKIWVTHIWSGRWRVLVCFSVLFTENVNTLDLIKKERKNAGPP